MDVLMPQLGETVTEGKVLTWFKAPGDEIAVGDILFEIETDKVTVEVQAIASGVLNAIAVKTGETVPVGTLMAVIKEAGAGAVSGQVRAESNQPLQYPNERNSIDEPDRDPGVAYSGASSERRSDKNIEISPLARRLMAENGLEIEELAARLGDGPVRRVGAAEVKAALAARGEGIEAPRAPGAQRQPSGQAQDAGGFVPTVEFSRLQQQTGERLSEAWRTIPHVYQAVEAIYEAIEKVRQQQKHNVSTSHGVSLTFLPFVARAVCLALRDFPRVNARHLPSGLVLYQRVNLGIAVDLSHDGLVVPVIHNAHEMTVIQLALEISKKIGIARAGKLTPSDITGATYTITNNGSFGTFLTAPLINPPQVGILSVDAVRKKPIVLEGEGVDKVIVQLCGILGQSFDHRAFDGAYSAAFLTQVKAYIETRNWELEF